MEGEDHCPAGRVAKETPATRMCMCVCKGDTSCVCVSLSLDWHPAHSWPCSSGRAPVVVAISCTSHTVKSRGSMGATSLAQWPWKLAHTVPYCSSSGERTPCCPSQSTEQQGDPARPEGRPHPHVLISTAGPHAVCRAGTAGPRFAMAAGPWPILGQPPSRATDECPYKNNSESVPRGDQDS